MASRKRKTINIKRVTTRSVGGDGIKKYITQSFVIDSTNESFMMENEERLQRLVDNFWGLDKDLTDRQYEISLMSEEDRRSMVQEYCLRMLKQHRQWDEEFLHEKAMKESMDREDKVQQRLDHLRLINSPYPVDEILQVIWNLEDAEPAPLLPNIATLSLNSLYSLPADAAHRKDLMEGGNLDASLSSLESVRMPLHLDGLQRSREIVDQAKANMKQVLKEIYSTSKAQKGLSAEGSQNFMSLQGNRAESSSSTNAKTEQAVKEAAAAHAAQQAAEVYYHFLLGHPKYHWDQRALLHAAFSMLDREQRGYLVPEQLSRIANDASVRDLLQYTVLWSVVKARNWDFFLQMLEVNEDPSWPPAMHSSHPHSRSDAHSRENSRDQHHSKEGRRNGNLQRGPPVLAPISRSASFRTERSTHTPSQPTKIATLPSWMRCVETLTREGRLPARRIRTHAEHTWWCELKGFRHDYWDSDHHGVLRNFRLMRSVQVGDCVWALHRNGVRWLPAVVEHIHHSPPGLSPDTVEQSSWLFDSADTFPTCSSVDAFSPYTYDVWYPMSEQELVDARLHSTSKQFLILPSQLAAEGLRPRPYPDERSTCAYAFDLVDVESAGILELSALIQAMKSTEMAKVVETSAVLAAIFLGVPSGVEVDNLLILKKLRRRKKTKVKAAKTAMPALLPVFIDTFSTQTESNNDENADDEQVKHKMATSLDCISKMDFLEFCDAVAHTIKYDIHRLRCK